ncbi:MAG: hypothetical protein MI922_05565 [Bacteroidales bacterium]|nr:hypothetical protein [Bacteroidales bacterium]
MSKYTISKESFGTFQKVLLKNTETGEYVGIIPNTGGAVNELSILQNGDLKPVLDSYSSDVDFKENLYSSFKGSNLFPFPNRINEGKYEFEGTNQQLNINSPTEKHAIHGLVYNKPFEIVKEGSDDQHAYLKLEYAYDGSLQGFPYTYALTIEYILHEKTGFTCISTVKNTGKGVLPCGSGWHPYFMAGETINDVSLEFPCKYFYPVDDVMIPTGEKQDYSEFNSLKPIGDTQFDSCFELKQESSKAEIKIKNDKEGFDYTVWSDLGEEKYNFLQIYTPPPRKTIALEPMTCAPDALNNKFGLLEVQPGDSKSFSWGVTR